MKAVDSSNGGKLQKQQLSYSAPTGIRGQTTGPGLGQDNYGNGQRPGRSATTSGSPGIGGTNHCCGTQDKD